MSTLELGKQALELPREERLNLIEILQESLEENDPASPDWHGDVLSDRLAKIERGEAKFITIEDFEAHFGIS